jgi:hypothetical protein
MYDDFEGIGPISPAPEDVEFIKQLSELNADGVEYGIALIDGAAYRFTSNLENRIFIPEELELLLDGAGEKDVKLYHNHPNGTAPSAKDLGQLLRKRVQAIFVVGGNGNVHFVKTGNVSLPSVIEYDEFRNGLAEELYSMLYKEITSGDLSIDRMNYIFAKEQAYRIAMQFGWKYYGGRIDEIL